MSPGEAQHQIQGGGLRANDGVLTEENNKLSLGKKRHVLLKPT